jgi:poly(3-hydroxyalkanoate) synthetase
MKCVSVLIISCIINCCCSQAVDSLNAISLLASQVDFLEEICLNRTANSSTFDELKETIEACQSMILNGTELTLTYSTLMNSNPQEFYSFYMS